MSGLFKSECSLEGLSRTFAVSNLSEAATEGVRRILLQVIGSGIEKEAMARQVRIEYEGAIYHVMCRGDLGDRREGFFEDDEDRRGFAKTLGETVERTRWQVHAFVLMSNHYHLLVETPAANRSKE
jgi:hypothetical protein